MERKVNLMDAYSLITFLSAFGAGSKDGKNKNQLSKGAEYASDVLGSVLTPRGNSIKYKAKELIAQYPVLFSDNLTSHSVMLVNRALEHEYVNLLQLLIQNDGVKGGFKNTASYLGGFHQNIHNDRNLDDTLNPAVGHLSKTGTVSNESLVMKKAIADVSKEFLTPMSEDLNYRSLNEESIDVKFSKLVEDWLDKDQQGPRTKDQHDKEETDKKDKEFNSKHSTAKANINNVEIKKANELTPTQVSVDLQYQEGGKDVTRKITFGVKCVAHLIESNDIEYYLPNSVITRTPIMRAIQWTTGEIKFFRDFMFAIDEIKKTAVKGNNKGGFWWRRLQQLSKISKGRASILPFAKDPKNVKKPIPTSTMVISKENVDGIRNRHGIDILAKPAFIEKIMANFFLMTFVIVDESIETVYIYNDDTKDFSTFSFKSLEGFSKQKDFDIKDLYKMLK
jgi:hypothetical protein